MIIGVIGTGNIGEVIISRLRDVGYPVKMANSRGPESLRDLAAKTGAIPVSVEEVVQDIDILFIVVPQKSITALPKGLLNRAKGETIVIDVGNYYPFRDGRIEEIENGLTESAWVEKQIGWPVIKVLNSIGSEALVAAGRPAGSRDRIALPISGDNLEAKEVVAQLIDRIGFDSVDVGTIAESWRQQPGSPVYCTNPTKEELQLWLKNIDRSSLATYKEKGLRAYLACLDADYQAKARAFRSVFMKMNSSSNLLVLGVTGQVGKLVANNLKRSGANFSVGSRRKANLEELANQFGASRFIDLDDPGTFDAALKDITGIFLITGYTVDMLVQSKTLIDAAKRNGVNHIVHLGAFTVEHDSYTTVFAWHQMIEAYLHVSGMAWTNLHPNIFMQNLLSVNPVKGGLYSSFTSKALGFTALEDVTEAAAVILMEGPEKHGGKDYWFSADALTPHQVAENLTAATGREFTAVVLDIESFVNKLAEPGPRFEPAYAKGGYEFFREVGEGRMAFVGSVRDDTKKILGREPWLLREWAKLHANELLKTAGR